MVGDILLDAIENSGSPSLEAHLREAAVTRGFQLGASERRARSRHPATKKGALKLAFDVLAARGYEPYYDERDGVRLYNCPFHSLAERSRERVCGINQAFIDGVLEGLGASQLGAELDPKPGECCVRLRGNESVA